MSDKGDLQVKATLDSTGFNAGLSAMKQHAKAFGNEVSSGLGASFAGIGKGLVGGIVGTVGLGGIVSALEAFISKASGFREAAEEMEMGADSVQKMAKAIQNFEGLSMSKFQGIVSKINEARIAAFTDPKERQKFAALGISADDILNTKGIDSYEFTKRVYAGGEGSAEQQARLAAIVGTKGTRYGPAVAMSGRMTPDFSGSQLDEAHTVHLEQIKAGNLATRAVGKMFHDVFNIFTGTTGQGIKRYLGATFDPTYFFRKHDYGGPNEGSGAGAPSKAQAMSAGRQFNGDGTIRDPMIDVIAKRDFEASEKQRVMTERLREAKRGNLTIGDRRNDIIAERMEIDKKIAAAEKQMLGPDEKLALTELKIKREGLTHSLRESPMSFTADSLAKVGGFTSSTVGFNPVVNIQQQMLGRLASIDNKMTSGRDHRQ